MSGYDQFFEAAKLAKKGKAKAAPSTEAAPKVTEQQLRQKLNVRPARKPSKFPVGPVVVLAAISATLGWWSVDPELPDRIISTVEVKFMGAAGAQEEKKPEKAAATKAEAKATSSAPAGAKKVEGGVAEAPTLPEELSHLEKLRERNSALDLRERELNELEEELHKQKVEIESRIKQLEELRTQIAAVLKERIEVDQEKVMKLVETYSNMKPKQAAEILAGIDEDLAVEVLGKMKKKNAAEIMNLLEPGKARALSEKYAGYRRR